MRRSIITLLVCLGLSSWAQAQTHKVIHALDASEAPSTKPMKTGTTLPGSCTVGDYFFDTDATAGSNTYACTSTDTWTLQGGGGGASPGGSSGDLQKNDGVGGLGASILNDDGTKVTSTTTPPASATEALWLFGSALSSGSSAGTYFGVNSGAGYTGDFLRFQVNGSDKWFLNYLGSVQAYAPHNITASPSGWGNSSWWQGFHVGVNGADAQTHHQAIQGGSQYAKVGMSAAMDVPASSTAHEAKAFFGSVNCGSDVINCVGGAFYARGTAASAKVWGVNPLVEVESAATNATAIAGEFDLNIHRTDADVIGISVGGGSTAQPTTANGFIANVLGSGIKWQAGFLSMESAANIAFQAGTLGGTGTGSQPIRMWSKTSGDTARAFDLQTNSDGDLLLHPYTADVTIEFQNQAQTDNALILDTSTLSAQLGGLLLFEGSTSSYPALQRSGAGIDLHLADLSGYTWLAAADYVIAASGSLQNVGSNDIYVKTVSDASPGALIFQTNATERLRLPGADAPLFANLGLEMTASDSNPGCTAGEYRLYADLSELKFKKCMNGAVTDMDTQSSTSPAGSSGQVQYNDSGSFGGDAGLTYDDVNDDLTAAGTVTADEFATTSTDPWQKDTKDQSSGPGAAASSGYTRRYTLGGNLYLHPNGGSAAKLLDEDDASATPGADTVPIAEGDGDLNAGWIGQDQSYTWTGTHDYGGGTLEIPNSSSLPGTCTEGQIYQDTDASNELYLCTSTNNWTEIGGGGGGLSYYWLGHTAYQTLAASETKYDCPHTHNLWRTNAYECNWRVPEAGTASNLYVYLNTAQPAGGSCVVTLLENGSPTSVEVTIAAEASAGYYEDTSNSEGFAKAGALNIRIVNNDSGAAGCKIDNWAVKYTP